MTLSPQQVRQIRRVTAEEDLTRSRAEFSGALRRNVAARQADERRAAAKPLALAERIERARRALYGAPDAAVEQRTEAARQALYGPRARSSS